MIRGLRACIHGRIGLPRMRGDDPSAYWAVIGVPCLPRMRGDDPFPQFDDDIKTVFAPHARG